MTQTYSSTISKFRQLELRRQILESIDEDDSRKLSLLQGLWVHRYGLEEVPASSGVKNHWKTNESFRSSEVKYKSIEDSSSTKKQVSQIEEKDLLVSNHSPEIIETNPSANIPDLIEKEQKSKKNIKGVDSSLSQKRQSVDVFNASPPPPTISRLRRWLPLENNEYPKAS